LPILSTYQLIIRILSDRTTGADLSPTLQTFQHWESLVYHGSSHLLLPAIYSNLKNKQALAYLPQDLQDYLQEIHEINHRRNLRLLEQIQQLHDILKAQGIAHVFLKGAAFLIKGAANNQLERMVGDIDILVDHGNIDQAFELLKQHGYAQSLGFDYEVTQFRHLDRQMSDDHLAAVELHRELLRHPRESLLPGNRLLNHTVLCNGLPIPQDTDMALHAIMAQQINDRGYYYRSISLKTLYDVMVLKVGQDPGMRSELHGSRYGRLFLIWAGYLKGDNRQNHLHFKQRILLWQVLWPLRFPRLGRLYLKLKKGLWWVGNRTYLWLSNKSYRQHIQKHKFNNIEN
jgi:hypothetical protein